MKSCKELLLRAKYRFSGPALALENENTTGRAPEFAFFFHTIPMHRRAGDLVPWGFYLMTGAHSMNFRVPPNSRACGSAGNSDPLV